MPKRVVKELAAKFFARCIEVIMSRVGQAPIEVPQDVVVSFANDIFTAKGKLGELSAPLPSSLEVEREGSSLRVKIKTHDKHSRMLWGTTRRNINNMVTGVSKGFTVNLEINGVGYRAAVQGRSLVMQLGYSHDIQFPIPEGIDIKCEKPTLIQVAGIDRQVVGQIAAKIRRYRLPEPYKGKGIKYENEIIVRKEGKKK